MASRPLGQAKLSDEQGLNRLARGLVIAALIFFFLYVGQPFLKPLVIAGLLSFILAPIIRVLRSWGVWRSPAVLLTVGAALLFLAALGSTLVLQLTDLAAELPRYEVTLQNKARELNGAPFTSSALERASSKLQELGEEIGKQHDASSTSPSSKPLLVEIQRPEPKGLQSIALLVRPLISPLTTTGLVILFLLFILLQREDLRDRFLRLAGTGDLHRTTVALDDAGERLSGYFLMQTAINGGFGCVIAIGLAAIGIPHAALWGILSGLLRYVPFIGTLISAFFPTLLAAAVDPGWTSVCWTIGLFAVAEIIARQILEPVLYGPHTGLSAVAVVVCTLLWTLLWGPVGLLLATPLTVCIVVFGRHIDAFNFIEVLFGDEPALEPEERFYQRLLAGDAAEASDVAEGELKNTSLSAFYDAVPMKALALAQYDAAQGKLSKEKQADILETMTSVVENMEEFADEPQTEAAKKDEQPPVGSSTEALPNISPEDLKDTWHVSQQIVCTDGRGAIDHAAAVMLAQLLRKHGLTVYEHQQTDPASKIADVGAAEALIVCVSHFETALASSQVRFIIRRLRRQMPKAKFLACLWTPNCDPKKLEEWRAAVGADLIASSLISATKICLVEASSDPNAISTMDTK